MMVTGGRTLVDAEGAASAPAPGLAMNATTPRGDRLWAIVLAGGRGVRLRPLVQVIHGDERPKQFAAIADSRSMLRHTLDRVALRIPPERTVVVVSQEDARYVTEEFRGASRPHVLVQPADRGTAAGILLPAHWISRQSSSWVPRPRTPTPAMGGSRPGAGCPRAWGHPSGASAASGRSRPPRTPRRSSPPATSGTPSCS